MDDDEDVGQNEGERTLNRLGDVTLSLTLRASSWFTVLEAVDTDLYRDVHRDLMDAIEIARLRLIGQSDQGQAAFRDMID